MNTKPKTQTKLYGLKHYFDSLTNIFDKNIFPNKILLSGPKGIGKATLAYHFVNYVYSKHEDYPYNAITNEINSLNRSFKLIENQSHPNFYNINLLDEKKNIEINQIREMINYTNKSSFNKLPRFILIDNVENLNSNSLNSLLKVVEEPNENIYFILIFNSKKIINDTLKSRCINYKINLSFDQSLEIISKILNEDIFKIINKDILHHYVTPGDLVNLINFAKDQDINLKEYTLKKLLLLIINENYYKKNTFLKNYIFNMIQHYFIKLLFKAKSKNIILNEYNSFVKNSSDCSTFNLNHENLFMEFKTKLLNE